MARCLPFTAHGRRGTQFTITMQLFLSVIEQMRKKFPHIARRIENVRPAPGTAANYKASPPIRACRKYAFVSDFVHH